MLGVPFVGSMVIAALIVGIAVGGAAAWLVLRSEITAGRRAASELETVFKALSSEALRANNDEFLQLATTKLERFHLEARNDLDLRQKAVEQVVRPLKESLERVDRKVESLEASRQKAYGALSSQVELLVGSQERLRAETAGLVKALRTSDVRGKWGEMQLRRALEISGMLRHYDFVEQPTAGGDAVLRPDVVVKLPGGKNIVIDSKVPLEALLDAFQGDDEAFQEARMQDFLRHVREHMSRLSLKAYWQQFSPSPEYVVMFLPSESFYRYAVERDATLLDSGPKERVLLASPTNLIALLLAAAAGWQEETLAESAREISELGRDLYDRLSTMGRHFAKLGGQLGRAVDAYNETVGSLEARVFPAARRFPELGVSAKGDIESVQAIERAVKPLTAAELTQPSAELAAVDDAPTGEQPRAVEAA